MASFNKIIIVGYLGRDPEIRYTPQGSAICNLSVATTEKRKDKNGDMQDVTTWFRVQVWGKQAEACSKYLTRGSQVYAEGRLRQDEYTDREGNKRQSLEVNATDVQFLGPKADASQGDDEQPARNAAHAAATKAQAPLSSPSEQTRQARLASIPEDDIPF